MCELCEGYKNLINEGVIPYQTNAYGNLYLTKTPFGSALAVDVSICPPYSECVKKDVNIRILYKIKYCPECGERLSEETGI